MRHEPHRKRHLHQFFFAAGTSLPSRCLATLEGYTDRPTDSPLIDTNRIENDASNNSSIVACIHCHGNVSTEPLPSNDTGHTHTDTQTDGRDL
jgi:hypothetical protein